MTRHRTTILLLFLILAAATALRLYGLLWDDDLRGYPHPDERHLANTMGRLAIPSPIDWRLLLNDPDHSPLNPRRLVPGTEEHYDLAYGTLPIYVYRGTAVLLSQLAGDASIDDYAFYRVIGRAISALFGVLAILWVYLIGRRISSTPGALLAAALLATCVLHIQLSHFMTVDLIMSALLTAGLLFAVRFAQDGRTADAFWVGLLMGLGMAAKFNGITLGAGIAAAYGVVWLAHKRTLKDLLAYCLPLTFIGWGLAFGLFEYYAIRDPYTYVGAIGIQAKMVSGETDWPYTRQYVNTAPYLFQLQNLVAWGMGWPLGIAGVGGVLAALIGQAIDLWRQEKPQRYDESSPPPRMKAPTPPGRGLEHFRNSDHKPGSPPRMKAPTPPGRGLEHFRNSDHKPGSPPRMNAPTPPGRGLEHFRNSDHKPGSPPRKNAPTPPGRGLEHFQSRHREHKELRRMLRVLRASVVRLQASLQRWADQPQRAGILVLLGWALPFFAYTAQLEVKFLRYMLPLTPVLCLLAAELLWRLGGLIPDVPQAGKRVNRALLVARGALVAIVLLPTALWALAYMRVYTKEHPWQAASRWFYEKAPPSSTYTWEAWGDPLPVNLPKLGLYRERARYQDAWMHIYHDMPPQDKLAHIVDSLRQADYVVLSTPRLYLSVARLPWRYPIETRYYELLFEQQLGYELVAKFTAQPGLGSHEIDDLRADQSFFDYDHPPVLIYRKTRELSDAEWHALFQEQLKVQPQVTREGDDPPLQLPIP